MTVSIRLSFTITCILWTVSIVQAQLTSCPPGVLCESEKCIDQLGPSRTCCTCNSWHPNGRCTSEGWTPTRGTGTCDFVVTPASPVGEDSCPPGVTCARLKCKDRTDNSTCCDCIAWNEDGNCQLTGWIPRVHTQSCDFTVAFSTERDTTQNDAQIEPDSNEVSVQAVEPVDEAEVTLAQEGVSEDEVPLSESATPSLSETVPLSISGPLSNAPLPESAPSGASAPTMIMESPSREDASALAPFEEPAGNLPCALDQECDTTKCGIIKGDKVCCECLIRKPSGICDKNGWFNRDNPQEKCALSVRRNN